MDAAGEVTELAPGERDGGSGRFPLLVETPSMSIEFITKERAGG